MSTVSAIVPLPKSTENKKRKRFTLPLLKDLPNLVEEIDWKRNEAIGLSRELILNLTGGSDKRLWWVHFDKDCGCEHSWMTSVGKRHVSNRGCPFCAKQKCCIHQSFSENHPHLIAQVDPNANQGVDLFKIRPNSSQLIDWLCNCAKCGADHRWSSSIGQRVGSGSGCPFCAIITSRVCRCSSIMATNPNLCAEIDFDNDSTMKSMNKNQRVEYLFSVAPVGRHVFTWKCVKNPSHSNWKASLKARNALQNEFRTGCPACNSSKFENSTSDVLKSLKLEFSTQFQFPGSRYKFDHLVKAHNGCASFLIEEMGTQHYTETNFGSKTVSKKECFKKQRIRDVEKEILASENKMSLLIIPYTHSSFDQIKNAIEEFIVLISQSPEPIKYCVNQVLYDSLPNPHTMST